MSTEPKLCYVDGNWAYFTTRELSEQWGDDWDDAPYEHNAEEPYGPCWHNDPVHRFDPKSKRGWRPGTKTPYDVGELCQCSSCKKDWLPDGTPVFTITKVAWDGPFYPPSDWYANSPWSVKDINSGAVAWLHAEYASPPVAIPAGTTLEEFCKLIKQGGGNVYLPLLETASQ